MIEEKRTTTLDRMLIKKRREFCTALKQAAEDVESGRSKEIFITCDHSHDYPQLIAAWCDVTDVPEHEREKTILDFLEHEYLHAVPALDYNELGITVTYGVIVRRHTIGIPILIPAVQ